MYGNGCEEVEKLINALEDFKTELEEIKMEEEEEE